MISNRNYNILQLYNLFTNEFSAFDFAFRMNLLYQSFNCRNCGSIVSIYTNNDQKFGLCFKCSKCKRFYSILYLSIFYHSKISINSVLYLIYCWSHTHTHTHTVCVPYYKAAPYNISHTKIFQWRFSL